MVQYFYIPLKYEKQLTDAVKSWEQKGGWTIITGIYKPCDYQNPLFSTVYNITVTREIQPIPYNIDRNELYGFLLEGDIFNLAPDFYNEIASLPDTIIFNTNIEYIAWQQKQSE